MNLFGKSVRLLHSGEFRSVYRQGRRYSLPSLTMLFLPRKGAGTDGRGPRLGLSISKKVGSAPVRNLLKRRLREVFRLHQDGFGPVDLVVVGRSETAALPYAELKEAFLGLCERAKSLKVPR